jgi:tetratricopeptide (TPR) repeat protein
VLAAVLAAVQAAVLAAVLSSGVARADDPIDAVDRLVEESGRAAHPHALRARFGREAVKRLDLLIHVSPGDARLHLRAGLAWIAVADEQGPLATDPATARHAEDELLATRRLDAAGAHAEEVAFELAVLYSKLGRFADSLAEYDRAIAAHALAGPYPEGRDPLESSPGRASLLYSNSAETLMALGRLPEAIARYRAALELTPSDIARLASLPLWGLAIALDRDGQIDRARAAIRQALARDPKAADLDDGNVFFVPAGEKLYYQALAATETGDPAAAADFLRRYLDTNPRPRWAARARERLAALAPLPAARR